MGRAARLGRERKLRAVPPQQFATANSDETFRQDLERWRQDRVRILSDVIAIAKADPQLKLVYGREWTPQEIQAAVASIERMLDEPPTSETNTPSLIFTKINQKEKAG